MQIERFFKSRIQCISVQFPFKTLHIYDLPIVIKSSENCEGNLKDGKTVPDRLYKRKMMSIGV
jgi:hypothetical protein